MTLRALHLIPAYYYLQLCRPLFQYSLQFPDPLNLTSVLLLGLLQRILQAQPKLRSDLR